MLHELLWTLNRDLAYACLEHPFVRGLAAGSLETEIFKNYIAQDAFFLEAFLRAYAVGAAKAGAMEQTRVFHELMGGVLEELKLHAAYAEQWGVRLDRVEPLPATRAYTNFLLRIAWHGAIDEMVAGMVPCMRLYAFLGTELAGGRHSGRSYGEWISTYSGEDFHVLVSSLEALLDAVAYDTPKVRDAYRYAMQCELDFFSSAMESAR